MNIHEWLSFRRVAIVGILIVVFCVCFYFFLRHDTQQFEASLPKVSAAKIVDTSPVSFTEEVTFDSSEMPIATEDTAFVVSPEKEGSLDTQAAMPLVSSEMCQDASCPMCSMSHMNADKGDLKGHKGVTNEEYSQAIGELESTFQTSHADELLDKMEEYLLAKWGPDHRIPELINLARTEHKLRVLLRDMHTTGYNTKDVDLYLSLSPSTVQSEMLDLGMDLFNPPEEEIAFSRKSLAETVERVEMFKLLQETRPEIQAAIDAGDFSPEEGRELIKAATGLNVTMHKRKNASTVNEQASPAENARRYRGTTSSENVDLNAPDFPGD